MKTKTLFILVLSNLIFCTSLFAQNTKKINASKKLETKATTSSISVDKEVRNDEQIKDQLLREWSFYQITLRSPKVGFLMNISDREAGMMGLLISNYAFKKDGSIDLDSKFMEKQGVKEAKWEMEGQDNIVITYYWTPEKQKAEEFTNNYEKLPYKIEVISEKELILNMSDMFIVKLIDEKD